MTLSQRFHGGLAVKLQNAISREKWRRHLDLNTTTDASGIQMIIIHHLHLHQHRLFKKKCIQQKIRTRSAVAAGRNKYQ